MVTLSAKLTSPNALFSHLNAHEIKLFCFWLVSALLLFILSVMQDILLYESDNELISLIMQIFCSILTVIGEGIWLIFLFRYDKERNVAKSYYRVFLISLNIAIGCFHPVPYISKLSGFTATLHNGSSFDMKISSILTPLTFLRTARFLYLSPCTAISPSVEVVISSINPDPTVIEHKMKRDEDTLSVDEGFFEVSRSEFVKEIHQVNMDTQEDYLMQKELLNLNTVGDKPEGKDNAKKVETAYFEHLPCHESIRGSIFRLVFFLLFLFIVTCLAIFCAEYGAWFWFWANDSTGSSKKLSFWDVLWPAFGAVTIVRSSSENLITYVGQGVIVTSSIYSGVILLRLILHLTVCRARAIRRAAASIESKVKSGFESMKKMNKNALSILMRTPKRMRPFPSRSGQTERDLEAGADDNLSDDSFTDDEGDSEESDVFPNDRKKMTLPGIEFRKSEINPKNTFYFHKNYKIERGNGQSTRRITLINPKVFKNPIERKILMQMSPASSNSTFKLIPSYKRAVASRIRVLFCVNVLNKIRKANKMKKSSEEEKQWVDLLSDEMEDFEKNLVKLERSRRGKRAFLLRKFKDDIERKYKKANNALIIGRYKASRKKSNLPVSNARTSELERKSMLKPNGTALLVGAYKGIRYYSQDLIIHKRSVDMAENRVKAGLVAYAKGLKYPVASPLIKTPLNFQANENIEIIPPTSDLYQTPLRVSNTVGRERDETSNDVLLSKGYLMGSYAASPADLANTFPSPLSNPSTEGNVLNVVRASATPRGLEVLDAFNKAKEIDAAAKMRRSINAIRAINAMKSLSRNSLRSSTNGVIASNGDNTRNYFSQGEQLNNKNSSAANTVVAFMDPSTFNLHGNNGSDQRNINVGDKKSSLYARHAFTPSNFNENSNHALNKNINYNTIGQLADPFHLSSPHKQIISSSYSTNAAEQSRRSIGAFGASGSPQPSHRQQTTATTDYNTHIMHDGGEGNQNHAARRHTVASPEQIKMNGASVSKNSVMSPERKASLWSALKKKMVPNLHSNNDAAALESNLDFNRTSMGGLNMTNNANEGYIGRSVVQNRPTSVSVAFNTREFDFERNSVLPIEELESSRRQVAFPSRSQNNMRSARPSISAQSNIWASALQGRNTDYLRHSEHARRPLLSLFNDDVSLPLYDDDDSGSDFLLANDPSRLRNQTPPNRRTGNSHTINNVFSDPTVEEGREGRRQQRNDQLEGMSSSFAQENANVREHSNVVSPLNRSSISAADFINNPHAVLALDSQATLQHPPLSFSNDGHNTTRGSASPPSRRDPNSPSRKLLPAYSGSEVAEEGGDYRRPTTAETHYVERPRDDKENMMLSVLMQQSKILELVVAQQKERQVLHDELLQMKKKQNGTLNFQDDDKDFIDEIIINKDNLSSFSSKPSHTKKMFISSPSAHLNPVLETQDHQLHSSPQSINKDFKTFSDKHEETNPDSLTNVAPLITSNKLSNKIQTEPSNRDIITQYAEKNHQKNKEMDDQGDFSESYDHQSVSSSTSLHAVSLSHSQPNSHLPNLKVNSLKDNDINNHQSISSSSAFDYREESPAKVIASNIQSNSNTNNEDVNMLSNLNEPRISKSKFDQSDGAMRTIAQFETDGGRQVRIRISNPVSMSSPNKNYKNNSNKNIKNNNYDTNNNLRKNQHPNGLLLNAESIKSSHGAFPVTSVSSMISEPSIFTYANNMPPALTSKFNKNNKGVDDIDNKNDVENNNFVKYTFLIEEPSLLSPSQSKKSSPQLLSHRDKKTNNNTGIANNSPKDLTFQSIPVLSSPTQLRAPFKAFSHSSSPSLNSPSITNHSSDSQKIKNRQAPAPPSYHSVDNKPSTSPVGPWIVQPFSSIIVPSLDSPQRSSSAVAPKRIMSEPRSVNGSPDRPTRHPQPQLTSEKMYIFDRQQELNTDRQRNQSDLPHAMGLQYHQKPDFRSLYSSKNGGSNNVETIKRVIGVSPSAALPLHVPQLMQSIQLRNNTTTPVLKSLEMIKLMQEKQGIHHDFHY